MKLRLKAALHELRCAECRVSWSGWARRLVLGDKPPAALRTDPTHQCRCACERVPAGRCGPCECGR